MMESPFGSDKEVPGCSFSIPPALLAIAALISSVSALVWAVRRKP